MLRLGSLEVDPPLWLAPMAGVTDRDFRLIVRRIGGVGGVSMEFLSARGLVEGDRRWLSLTHFVPEERPLAIQIYGADAATMEQAAAIVEDLGPDLCDINMGCPANKILKGCAGAALMADLDQAGEIVRRVRRRLSIPLTVKMRLGIDERRENFLELGRICEAEGVDGVTLHPRTARQKFSGPARWSAIGELAATLAIPVLGNGDIFTGEDAHRMLTETGCAGVMIGRGATRNPWIFAQAAARLSGGSRPAPTLEERWRLIRSHFESVLAREEETFARHKLATFTGVYSHGLPQGRELRRRIQSLPDAASFLPTLDEFFRAAREAAA